MFWKLDKNKQVLEENLTLVFDFDAYAGNIVKILFAHLTGRDLEGSTREMGSAEAFATLRMPDELFEALFTCRIYDPGDDGYERVHAGLEPTPGYWNDGMGKIYKEGDLTVPVEARNAPKKYPAYFSVGLYLQREPDLREKAYIEERMASFPKVYGTWKWGHPIGPIRMRLVTQTTTQTWKKY